MKYSAFFFLFFASSIRLLSLPVQITEFAGFSDGSTVYLYWYTATEDQNYGFSVERRDTGTLEWTQIAIVLGSGTVFDPHDYSYKDTNVVQGHYEYRLVQIDTDGDLSIYPVTIKITVKYPEKTIIENFSASLVNHTIQLTWNSLAELYVKGYLIQRKDSNSVAWDSVGYVPGAGTTITYTEYAQTDSVKDAGTYYYRLVQQRLDDSLFVYDSILTVTISSPTTLLEEEKYPHSFVLMQNYPNPFNPTTVISYHLPVISKVTLKIYDLLGRKIAMLVNEEQTPGWHETLWNANVASGLYYYKIDVVSSANPLQRISQLKKMLLLK